MLWAPSFDLAALNFAGGLNLDVGLKCFGVSGSEGYTSLFLGARSKVVLHSYSQYQKPPSAHCLVPTGIHGTIYEFEQYCSVALPVRIRLGSVTEAFLFFGSRPPARPF